MSWQVQLPKGIPSIGTVRDRLARHGVDLGMRMIEGQLAFPDEEPPERWSEIRVALAKNMITVRHSEGTLSVVTWGNADEAMMNAWHWVIWSFADAGGGVVTDADKRLTADEFAQRVGLFP